MLELPRGEEKNCSSAHDFRPGDAARRQIHLASVCYACRRWPMAPARSSVFPPRPIARARSIACGGSACKLMRADAACESPARVCTGCKRSRRDLDAGNSGTTMRMLSGILAGQSFDSTLTGDASLRRRPMSRVIEPLTQMGAEIRSQRWRRSAAENSRGSYAGIEYSLPVPSAQVKSAILLAGLFAEGDTSVTELVRTRDHTELALEEFGVHVGPFRSHAARHGRRGTSPAKSDRAGRPFLWRILSRRRADTCPNQIWSCTTWDLNPTRTAVLDLLAGWGAPISLLSVREAAGELVGDVAIRHSPLKAGRSPAMKLRN